jgi:hypothetical protein
MGEVEAERNRSGRGKEGKRVAKSDRSGRNAAERRRRKRIGCAAAAD